MSEAETLLEFLWQHCFSQKEAHYVAALLYPLAHNVWFQFSDREVEELIVATSQITEEDFYKQIEECYVAGESHNRRTELIYCLAWWICKNMPREGLLQETLPWEFMEYQTEDPSWQIQEIMPYVVAIMSSPLWLFISKCTLPSQKVDCPYLDSAKAAVLFRCISANSSVALPKMVFDPEPGAYSQIQQWYYWLATGTKQFP